MDSVRILHFADAHIDMANYGRHDPETGLPVRVMDFQRSLEKIVDTAIDEKVDLVIFAGDAYKDRNPQPTFQRVWGKQMMRLSQANVVTMLLVGNHDVAVASGRAHTVQEFKTLQVPRVHVADSITLWKPDDLGIPVQIISIPWISPSSLMTREEMTGKSLEQILELIESRLTSGIENLIAEADPRIPLILAAHASVQGAKYGSERAVMLGQELILSNTIVKDKRLDYVALGHIHKHQSLNDNSHPPVIYPGSIERIDFGEAREIKGFVLASVGNGLAEWQFVALKTRPFIDIKIEPGLPETFMADVMDRLPEEKQVKDAVCRLQLTYPRQWEPLVDDAAIKEHFKEALSFHIQKHRTFTNRARLGDTTSIESLTPREILEQYWLTIGLEQDEMKAMQDLAAEIFGQQL